MIAESGGFEDPRPTGTRLTLPLLRRSTQQRSACPGFSQRILRTSVGFGDRVAWPPPSLRARRHSILPIFAQQSVRENARTHRTPQQVIDDAMWGVFQAGWRKPWGADADHLKTTADVDSFFDAGFTFFTIDPGEHVDNNAQTDPVATLREKVRDLPWDGLQSTPEEIYRLYLDKSSGRRFPGDFEKPPARWPSRAGHRHSRDMAPPGRKIRRRSLTRISVTKRRPRFHPEISGGQRFVAGMRFNSLPAFVGVRKGVENIGT